MTEAAITLHGASYSVYTRIVRLALEEKGVAYRLEPIDIFAQGGPPAGYLARQPFARIPAFEHDGFRLYEAGAISRYVDETFEGPCLQAADPRTRARMNQIMSILDSYGFRSLVWDVFVERVRVPAQGGVCDEAKIEAGLAVAQKCLAAIRDTRGDDRWLAGQQVSLADCHAYPMLGLFCLARDGAAMMKDFPAMIDWREAFGERDSAMATRHPLEPAETDNRP